MNGTTTSDLNLRSAGDTGGKILAVIPKGTLIAITGDKLANGWYPVTYQGQAGYVSGAYLKVVSTPAPTTPSTATTPVGRFIDAAFKHLGKWYHIGGNGPTNFDCSGFCLYVLRELGYTAAKTDRTADSMMHELRAGRWPGTKITNAADIQPGDLIFFGYSIGGGDHHASHVVFALSPGWVIGANGGSEGTKTDEQAKARDAKVRIDKSDYRGKNDRLDAWRPSVQ